VENIPLNSYRPLNFSITNPNPDLTLTEVTFTDDLPLGLVVAPASKQVPQSCGGRFVTAIPGSSTIALSDATLAPGGSFGSSCSISLNVTGTTPGFKNNSVTATARETGPGNVAAATVIVVAPPILSKAFGATELIVGNVTTLTFTLTNPNVATTLT